jgi:hypothetical protein
MSYKIDAIFGLKNIRKRFVLEIGYCNSIIYLFSYNLNLRRTTFVCVCVCVCERDRSFFCRSVKSLMC